jgi:antitoxin component of MazEF toxin-antitoxin module
MEQIVFGIKTVSDKIRALNQAGFARAEIARFLGKRYQHVRNVLEGDKPRSALSGYLHEEGPPPTRSALADLPQSSGGRADVMESASAFRGLEERQKDRSIRIGNLFRLTVMDNGAVRLPKIILDAFGLPDGATVVADFDGETLTIMSPRESARRARARVPQWRPGEPMWSDDLIAERRREAAAEGRDV